MLMWVSTSARPPRRRKRDRYGAAGMQSASKYRALIGCPLRSREQALYLSPQAGRGRPGSQLLGRMDPAFGDDQRLRLALLALDHQLVERAEIGLGRGDEGVGIGALGGHRLAVLGEPHRHLRLGVGPLGDRMHLVELEQR